MNDEVALTKQSFKSSAEGFRLYFLKNRLFVAQISCQKVIGQSDLSRIGGVEPFKLGLEVINQRRMVQQTGQDQADPQAFFVERASRKG